MKRVLLVVIFLAGALPAVASVPDWMRRAAMTPVPANVGDANSVVLLDEQVTTVKDNGDVSTVYRRALKVLRPQGREDATVAVKFDKDTRLTWIKAWSIGQGKDIELKEKDAVETALFTEALYADSRVKILHIPVDVGAVFGYEYEQKRRPMVFEDSWLFQGHLPVAKAHFELHLPANWEYGTEWVNFASQAAQPAGPSAWQWEIDNIPRVESEQDMPASRAVAGRLALSYFPPKAELKSRAHASWTQIGDWYAGLIEGRAAVTPEIQARAAELTSAAKDPAEKIRLLASYVQHSIRYVAIEIGVGGYQPHAAADIFHNQYGDCKDKVTLLAAMLQSIGVQSHYVLVHTDRGMVKPEAPAVLGFDHVIVAIELPPGTGASNMTGLLLRPGKTAMLLFDPTSESTRFGQLPYYLQAGYGLLVNPPNSELVQLPVSEPSANKLVRSGKLELGADGTLRGEVNETRSGAQAIAIRTRLQRAAASDRSKVLEGFLSNFLTQYRLTGASVGNLDDPDLDLILHYTFEASNYAKVAGPLLLLRPRVLGEKSDDVMEKPRHYPVEFAYASTESDTFEIRLPEGYIVDELPPPMKAQFGFADYSSQIEQKGQTLRYARQYSVKDVSVDEPKFADLKRLYRQIAADERANAVLKRSAAAGQ
jgi:transglutaminase-like putative cysteine protease